MFARQRYIRARISSFEGSSGNDTGGGIGAGESEVARRVV